MNTVGPYHNRQETYEYFSLPFCRGKKSTIGHYHETLGEALQGTELQFSGLDISFKGTPEFSRCCIIYYRIIRFAKAVALLLFLHVYCRSLIRIACNDHVA